MSKPRTGAIFTQEILQDVTKAMEMQMSSEEQADDVFRRKVNALQKFLQHGMSRFSVETLQHVLISMTETDIYDMDLVLRLSSLKEVRNIVKRAIMKRESGSFCASDVDSLHYMELFFYCVYCMSEAKRLFELLFEDLFYSYYNPDEISRQNTRTMSASSKRIDGLTEAEHSSQFGISTLDIMTGSTHHKLKQTVQDMKMVLTRWDDLLTENDLDLHSFDPESEQDLVRLHGASGIEPVLRLVPDMFAKYYKCLELSKQWWTIAHEIYTGLPFQRRPSIADESDKNSVGFSSVTLQDMSVDDDTESMGLDNEMESDEVSNTLQLIQTLNEEIEVLERREEKFEVLMETYNKVGSDIEQLKAKRNRLLIEQESIKAKGLPEEIARIEAQLNHNSGSIKLLEFQHALLFEDYVIHLELRPSIIRFLQDAKIQLSDAHNTLVANRRGNKNVEQPVVHDLQQKVESSNTYASNKNHKYQSEYSLQSIERGVREVSDRCMELEQDSSITRARKESLSKLNKRHSEKSLLKKTEEHKNTNNKSLKHSSSKPDLNNNGDVRLSNHKPNITRSSKNGTAKTGQNVISPSDRKDSVPNMDNSKKQINPNAKRRSLSEPQASKRVEHVKNDNTTKSVTPSDKGKSQEVQPKNSDKTISLKPKHESKGKVPKPPSIAKHGDKSDKNINHKNDVKVTNDQDGAAPKMNPDRRKLSNANDRKGPSGFENKTGKESETKPKLRQNPPTSTQLDHKRPRAK